MAARRLDRPLSIRHRAARLREAPVPTPWATAIPITNYMPPHLEALELSLRTSFGSSAPRLRRDTALASGPHIAADVPSMDDNAAQSCADILANGLTPLHDLNLHAALPAESLSRALALLTSGAGRAMRSKTTDQVQYLVDLSDQAAHERFYEIAAAEPALAALRTIMHTIIQTPGVASVPGVLDAQPVAGVADERHFWLRVSSGGDGDGSGRPRFNTNGNAAEDAAEACWHVDNPNSPTVNRTSRLMLKFYSSDPPHAEAPNETASSEMAPHVATAAEAAPLVVAFAPIPAPTVAPAAAPHLSTSPTESEPSSSRWSGAAKRRGQRRISSAPRPPTVPMRPEPPVSTLLAIYNELIQSMRAECVLPPAATVSLPPPLSVRAHYLRGTLTSSTHLRL